jgi:hypothetical protein
VIERKKGSSMFLYVFEDVLTDYTSGLVVIAAESDAQALEFAREEYGDAQLDERGWRTPSAVYPVSGVPLGIRHEVFGGS